MPFGFNTNWMEMNDSCGGSSTPFFAFQWSLNMALYITPSGRLYDSNLGRFLSRDPVPNATMVNNSAKGAALGQWQNSPFAGVVANAPVPGQGPPNPYIYAQSNPVNAVDPTGLQPRGVTVTITPVLPTIGGTSGSCEINAGGRTIATAVAGRHYTLTSGEVQQTEGEAWETEFTSNPSKYVQLQTFASSTLRGNQENVQLCGNLSFDISIQSSRDMRVKVEYLLLTSQSGTHIGGYPVITSPSHSTLNRTKTITVNPNLQLQTNTRVALPSVIGAYGIVDNAQSGSVVQAFVVGVKVSCVSQ